MKIKFFYVVPVMVLMITAGNNSFAMTCGSDMEAATNTLSAQAAKETCPVSGEIVEKGSNAVYEYNGKIYNFCCPSCIDKFKENPDKYITAHQHDH